MGDMFRPRLGHHQALILKLGPDDDLDEVETCRPGNTSYFISAVKFTWATCFDLV